MKVEDLVGPDPVVKTDEIMVLHDELGYTVRQGDGTTVFSELPEIKLLAINEANKEYEFEYFTDDSGEEVDGSTFTGLLMVDTYENFSKINPVLLDGQIAICEQSIVGKAKVRFSSTNLAGYFLPTSGTKLLMSSAA